MKDPQHWLNHIFPPHREQKRPAGDVSYYGDMLETPEAAAIQAAHDNDMLADLRAGRLNSSVLQDHSWQRANFNRLHGGMPVLHHLVAARDLPALLLLVSGRVNDIPMSRPGDTDMQGRTAYDLAREQGWDEGAHYLKLYGHGIEGEGIVDNHQTRIDRALKMAVEKGDAPVCRAALQLGASVDAMARHDLTVFHHAVLLLHHDIVRLLAEHGADVQKPHSRGESTLQLLWWCHHPKRLSPEWHAMVDLLRGLGADSRDFKTPREMTAAELALPPPMAFGDGKAMDYALLARDYDTYRRALAALPDRAGALMAQSAVLSQSALESLCFADSLQEVFREDLWTGDGAGLRRAWAAIAADSLRPVRWRDDKPCSFTPEDFARVCLAVDRANLAARAQSRFKISKKGPAR